MVRVAVPLLVVFALGCHRPTPQLPNDHVRPFAIPATDPEGPDRQVKVLLDGPNAKIVAIRLRNGASLPEHTAAVPVIVQAVSGAGVVVVGAERIPIDGARFVTLPPSVPHSVVPDPGSELVLLVVQLRAKA